MHHRGRLKDRILRKRPFVSLIILVPENKARWIVVRGSIIDIADDVNRKHINALAMKYMGMD